MTKSLKKILAVTMSFLMVLGTVAVGGSGIADLLGIKASADEALYSAGDVITLGKYEQDNNTADGKEDIEWIVLDPSTGLCVSKYALDAKAFDSESGDYAESDIRAWLYGEDGTGEFYTNAFTDDEKSTILQKDIVTYAYNSSTEVASTLTDKVFLLSVQEAGTYFTVNSARKCNVTDYAVANGAIRENNAGWWWLRSPGSASNTAIDIGTAGNFSDGGAGVTGSFESVRPALYLDFESEITLDANDGTDETEKHTVSNLNSYYPDCPFTSDTKVFRGWYRDEECQEPWGEDDIVTEDMTLYAGWYETGDVIEYGTYPQSKVEDETLVAVLDAAGGTWVSYGYYSGSGDSSDGLMVISDYMRYKDVIYKGDKYRAVTFDTYRPEFTGEKSTADTTDQCQQDNGYTCGNIYWFKYEPIKWRVLDPSTGMVMCNTVIDSQAYNNYCLYKNWNFYGDSDYAYYANNYAESSIRQWLNNDFCNTAFSDDQKANILTTTLDNSAYESTYDSASTSDKVYLLSYSDVFNSSYGFSASAKADDTARTLEADEYAKVQGYDCEWLLRSAGSEYSSRICCVSSDGDASSEAETYRTSCGIVPVINLQTLKSDISGSEITVSNGDGTHTEYDSSLTATETATCTYTSACTATCTAAGTTTYTCSVCGYKYSEDAAALGHSFTSYVADKNATCTKNETETAKCDRCDVTDTREIADSALDHTPAEAVKENEIAPTCTETGSYDSVIYCSVCNAELSIETVTVPALGHSFTNYVSDKNASCTVNGTETAKCDRCDVTDTREIADSATGHTPAAAVKENEVAPTCTADGSYDSVVYCSVCNAEISRETASTPALGHSFTNYVSDNNAACTANGTETAKCDRCDATDTREIADSATGHDYSIEYVWSEDSATGDWTCTATATCKNDSSHVVTETSSAFLLSAIGASCYSEGAKTYIAEFGNELFKVQEKTVTIPKTEHTPAEAVKENETPAACTEGGSYDNVVYCSVCHDEISRETVTVPATGHNWTYTYEWAEDFTGCTATCACNNCGKIYTFDGAVSVESETPATCTEAGSRTYAAVFTNGKENHTERKTVEIPATGHDYNIEYEWSTDSSTDSPVCTTTATCKNDSSHVVTETSSAFLLSAIGASCYSEGAKTYGAKFSNSLFEPQTNTVTVPKTEHTPAEAVKENETSAACTEGGSYDNVVYCSVCHDEISRETIKVDAKGHTPEEAVKENETAPTCTETGSYDSVIYCSVCNAELSRETVTVPAAGHSFTSYVNDNNATCTKNATETAKCDNCDASDTREIADSALGHTYKDAVRENEVAPTCTEDGSYESVVYCSVCGDEISRETISVPATGHSDNDNDGRCDVCGADLGTMNPLENALIEVPSDETIGWKFRATIEAVGTDIPEGYHIAWFEGDTKVSDSQRFTTDSLTEAHTYTAKIVDSDGNVASSDSQNKSVTVNVRTGMINMIISFYLRLFGRNTVIIGGPFIFTGC